MIDRQRSEVFDGGTELKLWIQMQPAIPAVERRGCLPHPHTAVTIALVSAVLPVSVMFVCMGNICRSPMAAAVLRSELERSGVRHVTVSSAGTGGWHVGDPADRRARTVLERRGYQTDHQAQQFRSSWFEEYQLVVAMDRDNLRDLQRMAPTQSHAEGIRLMLEFDQDADGLDVPDPYYGGSDDFEQVLTQIESACRGLVSHLQTPSI